MATMPLIRLAKANDAASLVDVHTRTIMALRGYGYSDEQLRAWSSGTPEGFARVIKTSPFCIVFDIDHCIVGFATLREDFSLWHLYVNPTKAGQGIGTALLNAIENYLRQKGIEKVKLESSHNAKSFYLKRGYQEIGEKTLLFSGVKMPVSVMEKELIVSRPDSGMSVETQT